MSSRSKKQSRGQQKEAARERVAAMRQEQERKERRGRIILWTVTGVALVGIIGGVTVVVLNDEGSQPVEGLQEFDDLSRDHVAGAVDYEQTPPVGGDHAESPQWLNCGVYAEPVGNENAVHSMEHGAVWITYQPDIGDDSVGDLEGFVNDQSSTDRGYLILSPFDDLPAPIVASAWGKQLQVDDPDDPRLQDFVDEYVRGEQTPEPGAACSSGVGTPDGA